jgi:hypothetical protein
MNDSSRRLPLARTSDLIIEKLPDEVLVYDYQTTKAHCLNSAAALVWANCDGLTTIADATQQLQQEMKVPIGDEVVWLALEQLKQARLLKSAPAAASAATCRAAGVACATDSDRCGNSCVDNGRGSFQCT